MDREIGHVRLGWDIREIADFNDVDDDDEDDDDDDDGDELFLRIGWPMKCVKPL